MLCIDACILHIMLWWFTCTLHRFQNLYNSNQKCFHSIIIRTSPISDLDGFSNMPGHRRFSIHFRPMAATYLRAQPHDLPQTVLFDQQHTMCSITSILTHTCDKFFRMQLLIICAWYWRLLPNQPPKCSVWPAKLDISSHLSFIFIYSLTLGMLHRKGYSTRSICVYVCPSVCYHEICHLHHLYVKNEVS